MNATLDEWRDHDAVLKTFDGFFKVRQSILFEWAQFNDHSQHEEETS